MNDKSIVTQNDLNKSKVTLGAMQISLHTNPIETTTNKCGIELGREERENIQVGFGGWVVKQ